MIVLFIICLIELVICIYFADKYFKEKSHVDYLKDDCSDYVNELRRLDHLLELKEKQIKKLNKELLELKSK